MKGKEEEAHKRQEMLKEMCELAGTMDKAKLQDMLKAMRALHLR
jgi:hypothetical protein